MINFQLKSIKQSGGGSSCARPAPGTAYVVAAPGDFRCDVGLQAELWSGCSVAAAPGLLREVQARCRSPDGASVFGARAQLRVWRSGGGSRAPQGSPGTM